HEKTPGCAKIERNRDGSIRAGLADDSRDVRYQCGLGPDDRTNRAAATRIVNRVTESRGVG
ncbi:MAG TPA: hypothetical protein PLV92_23170, partial [Pirellulaceae bacterium]|nr:hypothetical protein [Pirellulaceae bacterium]